MIIDVLLIVLPSICLLLRLNNNKFEQKKDTTVQETDKEFSQQINGGFYYKAESRKNNQINCLHLLITNGILADGQNLSNYYWLIDLKLKKAVNQM